MRVRVQMYRNSGVFVSARQCLMAPAEAIPPFLFPNALSMNSAANDR